LEKDSDGKEESQAEISSQKKHLLSSVLCGRSCKKLVGIGRSQKDMILLGGGGPRESKPEALDDADEDILRLAVAD
jgi:hypothetical protein